MDMYNSEIVSYSISKQPNGESVMAALEEALAATADCKYRRTFHSDQGWAYQMKAYSRRLRKDKVFQSMSRKGNCYDDSKMEKFFSILKQEMYYGNTFYSYNSLAEAIAKYIEYYNTKRIKRALAWKSPVQYRIEKAA